MADPGARPMTPGVRAGLVAIASVIFWLGLSLFVFPSDTDDAVRLDDPATAHRRVPRRELLGLDHARRSPARWSATGSAARAFAAPYLIAGVVLLVVTLVHIDRFHMDAVTGWAWLVLYAIFPPRGRAAAHAADPDARGGARARGPDAAAPARGDRRVRRRAVCARHRARHRAARRRLAVAVDDHPVDGPRDRHVRARAGRARAYRLPRARLGPRAAADATSTPSSASCSSWRSSGSATRWTGTRRAPGSTSARCSPCWPSASPAHCAAGAPSARSTARAGWTG